MESKIIKAFFDGEFSDQVIKSPRTDEYKDIDKLYSATITKKIVRKIFREEERQRSELAMRHKSHCSKRSLP